MSTLLEPFRYPFFVHGVYVSVLAGALCGLIGVYVILRGMSYIGHGMSHSILGGAVVSFILRFNFYLGAGLWGFISALMVNRVARRRIIGADAAIGVVTTASFAIGIVLISQQHKFNRNFDAALFGNVLAVSLGQVLIVGGVMTAAALIVAILYRPLLFTTFDPEVAEASGINTGRIDALFALLIAATIVSTMQIIGVLLVAAALIVPPAIARMLTDSFARMLWLSVGIGAFSGFVGMYLSWFLNFSSGGSIVLVSAALFLVVFTVSGARDAGRLRAADAHV
jgi:manganese/iron transport system permease protein/iron/zinc/copper transport system permease protein